MLRSPAQPYNGLWPIRVLVAWLDGLVEILVSVEFTTLDDEVPGGPQSFGAYIISQATGFLRYAAKLCSKSFDHTL